MKKLSGKERFTLTMRILAGMILLWIIMKSGIAGSIIYWNGLESVYLFENAYEDIILTVGAAGEFDLEWKGFTGYELQNLTQPPTRKCMYLPECTEES